MEAGQQQECPCRVRGKSVTISRLSHRFTPEMARRGTIAVCISQSAANRVRRGSSASGEGRVWKDVQGPHRGPKCRFREAFRREVRRASRARSCSVRRCAVAWSAHLSSVTSGRIRPALGRRKRTRDLGRTSRSCAHSHKRRAKTTNPSRSRRARKPRRIPSQKNRPTRLQPPRYSFLGWLKSITNRRAACVLIVPLCVCVLRANAGGRCVQLGQPGFCR